MARGPPKHVGGSASPASSYDGLTWKDKATSTQLLHHLLGPCWSPASRNHGTQAAQSTGSNLTNIQPTHAIPMARQALGMGRSELMLSLWPKSRHAILV